jgi:hypothetical protein
MRWLDPRIHPSPLRKYDRLPVEPGNDENRVFAYVTARARNASYFFT